jgi:ABC-type multidrug transport system fused ATPase/permease subunit
VGRGGGGGGRWLRVVSHVREGAQDGGGAGLPHVDEVADEDLWSGAAPVAVSAGAAAGVWVRDASFGWATNAPDASGSGAGPEGGEAQRRSSADRRASSASLLPGDDGDAPVRWVLEGVSMTATPGTLTLLVGSVGSGKSTLLSGLVGECVVRQGGVADAASPPVRVAGSIAYTSQSAWVLNRTLRHNITFGRSYKPAWFARVVAACGLDVDAASLQVR